MRTQLRGIESQLYNKANELQEDISMKKFDLRSKQILLAAVKAQVRFFFPFFIYIKRFFLFKTFQFPFFADLIDYNDLCVNFVV